MKKIRIYENFHIILWLLKDTCWLLHLRTLGTIMVFPTLFMAIYITWIMRNNRSHLIPNLAVCCWISANITWMLGEFYVYDFKLPALVFFLLGMISISYYFVETVRASRQQNTPE